LRGDSFELNARLSALHAAFRTMTGSQLEDINTGFRVARVNVQAPIPAVSDWGMVVLTLVVLTAGTLALARRRLRA